MAAKMRASPRAPTRAELLDALHFLMPRGAHDDAIRVLDSYPAEPGCDHTREHPERVQMAALALSGGTLDGLRRNVGIALSDYRDLLAGASMMPWAADYRAVEIRLGEAGLSPWAGWLRSPPPGDGV